MDARHNILSCRVLASNPLVPFSTMKQEYSFFPSGRVPVRACTVTPRQASVEALVINILDPLMTHSSPSLTAVVLVPPASEPASGSVNPNPHTLSPVHK